jgi:hypothetical protein
MVERPTGRLFRRHVGRRPHDHAHFCAAGRGHRGIAEAGSANIFCQPEVQHLDAAFVRNHDIRRLQVAMYDAFLVRRRQRVSQGTGNLNDLPDREAASGNQAVQWLPFDQLHRQEVDAVAFLHRVDSDNVRVVELGKRLCLTAKAAQSLRIVRHLGGQHLERYVPAQFRVGGAIDLAHAARTEGRKNLVRSQTVSRS